MTDAEPAVVLVLTTIPVDLDGERLARLLVGERLAACVSVLAPMRSTYWWEGAVESADERQVVIKTVDDRVDALRARLQQLHPYDVPEFLVLAADGGSAPYLAWVMGETREPQR